MGWAGSLPLFSAVGALRTRYRAATQTKRTGRRQAISHALDVHGRSQETALKHKVDDLDWFSLVGTSLALAGTKRALSGH